MSDSNNNTLVDVKSDVTTSTTDIPWAAKKAVLFFSAEWHEGCAPLGYVLQALAANTSSSLVFFGRMDADAEQTEGWAERYNVTVVPTIVLVSAAGTIVEKLEGAGDPSKITVAVQRLMQMTDAGNAAAVTASSSSTAAAAADEKEALKQRLDRLIRSDQVMVFMKGSPSAPRCGFSRQTIELLQEHEVPFGTFDILGDETVRQGLKTYSDWPTYPQLYVKGELVGGLDILKEMAEEGPLSDQWGVSTKPVASSKELLDDRLKKLVNRHEVMLFMKGLPSAPGCGFSRKMVQLLEESNVAFDAFNILEDEEVRQGLKKYSDWPTYPQLYVKGELIGGLDICEELAESNELVDMLKQQ
jgi:Grx4 family monothiol glutaredoxin